MDAGPQPRFFLGPAPLRRTASNAVRLRGKRPGRSTSAGASVGPAGSLRRAPSFEVPDQVLVDAKNDSSEARLHALIKQKMFDLEHLRKIGAVIKAIARLRVLGIACDALLYVEDTLLAADPAAAPAIWPMLTQELADVGLKLKPPRCSAYIPSALGAHPALTGIVPQRFDGMPLLGEAVDGEFETVLGRRR